MKPLGPIKLVTLGPLLLGLILAAVAGVLQPGARTAQAIAAFFITGTSTGLVFLAPFALAMAFRRQLWLWIGPYLLVVRLAIAMLMAVSMAYVFGLSIGRFGLVAVCGLYLTPIGLTIASRTNIPGPAWRPSRRIKGLAAVLMSVCFGYAMGSIRHTQADGFDIGLVIALACVGLCAMAAVVLAMIFDDPAPAQRESPPPPPQGGFAGIPIGPRKPAPLVARARPPVAEGSPAISPPAAKFLA